MYQATIEYSMNLKLMEYVNHRNLVFVIINKPALTFQFFDLLFDSFSQFQFIHGLSGDHDSLLFPKKNEEHIRIKFRGRDHQGGNNLFHFNIINSLHVDLLYTLLSFLLTHCSKLALRTAQMIHICEYITNQTRNIYEKKMFRYQTSGIVV